MSREEKIRSRCGLPEGFLAGFEEGTLNLILAEVKITIRWPTRKADNFRVWRSSGEPKPSAVSKFAASLACRRLFDALLETERTGLDLHVPGFDFGEIQNVIDHPEERLRAAADGGDEILLLNRKVTVLKELGETKHAIHGGADFLPADGIQKHPADQPRPSQMDFRMLAPAAFKVLPPARIPDTAYWMLRRRSP